MTYTVVIITSLYAIVKDGVKKTENQWEIKEIALWSYLFFYFI
jgi:hypothetical protein